ncbi:MAG: GNAT family N-acetyltransferase [Thermomicrobiales bacterium]
MPVSVLDPNLRAGWEPDTSVEDSLLRRFLVNWTDSIEAHGLPAGGRRLRRDDLAAVDMGRPSFGGNVATLLAPLFPEDVDEVTAVLDDFYRFSESRYSGTAYLFSPWPTPDLRSHGWILLGYEPLMLRPPGGAAPPEPPGLRIEDVRDEETLLAFELAMVRGFESPELEAQGPGAVFASGILGDDRLRLWVGWEEDRPVSAAATFVAAGVNNVILVGTVPEARRRGYGAALTWRATLADPELPALLLATDEGRPVYERMGYLSLFRFVVWSRERPGQVP